MTDIVDPATRSRMMSGITEKLMKFISLTIKVLPAKEMKRARLSIQSHWWVLIKKLIKIKWTCINGY